MAPQASAPRGLRSPCCSRDLRGATWDAAGRRRTGGTGPERERVRGRLVAGAALGVLLAGVGGLTAARAGEAPPGSAVEGTGLGGLDREQVRAEVERLAQERTSGALPVVAREVRADLSRDLVEVDVDATVDAVMDDGASPLTALLRRGDDVELRTLVDRDRLAQRLTALARAVDREPSRGGIAVQGLTVTATPPAAGRELHRRRRRPGRARPRAGPPSPWRCRSPTSPRGPRRRRWRRSPERRVRRSPGRTSSARAPSASPSARRTSPRCSPWPRSVARPCSPSTPRRCAPSSPPARRRSRPARAAPASWSRARPPR